MAALSRWFRSLFAWRAILARGTWVYLENEVTGQRKAVWKGGCYSPMTTSFMRKGDIVVGPRSTYVIGEESELWA